MTTLALPEAFSLYAIDKVDSTNAEAVRLASKGAPHLSVVWAKEQTAGRGRFDRPWLSDRGNLYCSTIVRFAPGKGGMETLSLVAALATADAVRGYIGTSGRVCLKWVNDVLIDDCKVSGSLNEGSISEGWVVVGIGINIGIKPPIDNPDYEATSLSEITGQEIAVEDVLGSLCTALEIRVGQWLQNGFAEKLHADYSSLLWRTDEQVRVSFNADKSEAITGINRGITQAGHLRLELPDGTVKTIHAGDVLGPIIL